MPRASSYPLGAAVRQSPPIDYDHAVDDTWVKDKTIIITGGASGFGAGFFERWAFAGSTVIIGDIDVEKGQQLVYDVQKKTGNTHLHFFYCDVKQWQSQVQLFKEAVRVSTHGGIDVVVANAGIVDTANSIERPENIDAAEPAPPNLAVLEVNLTGVLYTVHLALFYLPRNPGSLPANSECDLSRTSRDRHLLLISSLAGLLPLPGNTLYSTSKHAVVGLFRSLRSSSFVQGIRVNMLCPYFVDTPLFSAAGHFAVAGGVIGRKEDVMDAGTRFVADPRILGRAVVVGPKMKVKQSEDGEWKLVEAGDTGGKEKVLWEAYADDFEDSELFTRNYVRLLNRLVEIRGWMGWFSDILAAVKRGVGWS